MNSDDGPERAFADPVLLAVAVRAQRQSEFIVRLLAHAAVLVVRARLHSDMGRFAGFVIAAKARKLSDHRQVDWIGIADDFQLDPLRYGEGAFE